MTADLAQSALDVANGGLASRLHTRRHTPVPDCPQPESPIKRIVNPPLVHVPPARPAAQRPPYALNARVEMRTAESEWRRSACMQAEQAALAAPGEPDGKPEPMRWFGGCAVTLALVGVAVAMFVARAEGWLP